jgi:hypothetical protein
LNNRSLSTTVSFDSPSSEGNGQAQMAKVMYGFISLTPFGISISIREHQQSS